MKLFNKIGAWIEKSPFKVLLLSILVFALMIAGAVNVKMATGNETLVDIKSDAYISNKTMEDNFGGDSILILFEGDKSDLMSIDTVSKMWDLEKQFAYEENIFSFVSPASMVHQMSAKASTQLIDQVLVISDGLKEVSSKLIEVGLELGSKDIKDPALLAGKLDNLSNVAGAFDKLIVGQNNLAAGASQLGDGLSQTSAGLAQASTQIEQLAALAKDNPQLQNKLINVSKNISNSSAGVATMSANTNNLVAGANNTAVGLSGMKVQLTNETVDMKSGLTGGIDPAELSQMAAGFVTIGENLSEMSKGLSLFHSKSGMMSANIPNSQSELDQIFYDENMQLRPLFNDVIIDDTHHMMVIKLQGNLEDSKKDAIYQEVSAALDSKDFEDVAYVVSGKPVLDSALRSEMQSNMIIMVALAVLVMFIILLLVFHVRWRVLGLGVIFTSVIATLGFMGTMSVPMTMVSMAVFPILIGLGIDYSIQLQNRYEEEKSVKTTLTQIGKSVSIAVIATVLGFISLYSSPVPMIKDFGKMLTIGVIISFIGSIFIMMPILKIRDSLNNDEKDVQNKTEKETRLDKFLKNVTKFVLKHSILIMVFAIVLAGLGFSVDSKIAVETDIETFMPQDMEALADIHGIRDIVGSTNQMVIYMEDDKIVSEQNIAYIDNLTKKIEMEFKEKVVDVKSISTLVSMMNPNLVEFDQYVATVNSLPASQSKMFINADGDKSVILLNISYMATEDLKEFVADLKDLISDAPMDAVITGKSVLDVEMVKGLTEGRIKMTVIGLALVFLALLLMYRNPFKAFIPIFPIILIIGMSAGIMYMLNISYTPITATLGALVLGMGTEMTIMLLERYLEERSEGKEKVEAMLITVTKIGKATLASGLTTIGGFSVLMVSQFVILKDFGLMTVINISLALLATFIVLPGIIILLDRFIVKEKNYK